MYRRGRRGRRGSKRSVRRLVISLERMLLSMNIERIEKSVRRDDMVGLRGGLCVITVAAAETAVGLGRRVGYYRVHGNIGREDINRRQG